MRSGSGGERRALVALIATCALLAPAPLLGASEVASDEVPWGHLLIGLFGGLALFLYGMERLGDSLKAAAGERLRSVLAALSSNRFIGLLTGMLVTAVIQSSSVTTVMLVGFVSAGLMSLSQSIGVILGADIGTTITAQIVAFKVTKYALVLVAGGFFVLFVSKNERRKQYGYAVMGLGLIFFGMSVMSDAMRPLRDYEPFLKLMQGMSNPLAGIATAAVFTALVQSSSATMGVVIVLAMQGVISLEGGIALAMGANIGTCVTAGLAAIGKPREAVRVAVAHVMFKVLGVTMIVPFIGMFAELVVLVSPGGEGGLSGQAHLASVVPRQVANAHTIFNCVLAFVFIPFTTPFARLITRIVPDRPLAEERAIIEAKYLDPLLLETPGMALDAVRREIARLGKRVMAMLTEAIPVVLTGTAAELTDVEAQDEEIDALYGRIVSYLAEISRRKLSEVNTTELAELMAATNDLESIGDIIETDLVALGRRRIEEGVNVSEDTIKNMAMLHAVVLGSVGSAIVAVTQTRADVAADVIGLKSQISDLVAEAERYHAGRLLADAPDRVKAYALEIDIVDKLRRIYYHAKRVAKTLDHTTPDDQLGERRRRPSVVPRS